eukprot:CAMPEP_0196651536 /NCGR_PEP_ID=MMETSP1086-20130531/544_1 /TAXON_ID=77921 /ORGANISM="Cyanoptyche  gloeocystis , Strain SAG4.97" /LENGTH=418 /DNA_ID=CAMNT_0041981599 /DNA_START=28 /DNA_END=1284 /DNA_ORIENTATION=+
MSSDSEEDQEEEQEQDISSQEVVTKYRLAGDIVNRSLQKVIAECRPGALVVALCDLGDKAIVDETKVVYTKTKIEKGVASPLVEKGVAFPTCVSVNNCVGHYSPLASESTLTLNAGDIVKIDCGCHIDGFIAVAATTIVCGQDPNQPVTGKAADVIMAAWNAGEAALRLVKPGNKNTQVTAAIEKIAKEYGVNAVEGVLSHQMKRFVIDASKVIMNKTTVDQKVDEVTFEPNDVYHIDIVMTSGDGKTKELGDERTTVYKRAVDQNYNLKMKASRHLLNLVNTNFPALPFTLRAVGDEKIGRLGVVECVKHELLHPYPVLFEKPGECVARFAYTVLLMPTGPLKLPCPQLVRVKSEKQIQDAELKSLVFSAVKKGGKKKKKASKGNAKQGDNMQDDEDDGEGAGEPSKAEGADGMDTS